MILNIALSLKLKAEMNPSPPTASHDFNQPLHYNTNQRLVLGGIIMVNVAGSIFAAFLAALVALFLYLLRVNQLLSGTPDEVRKLSGSRWTQDKLKKTYERLEESPIDYTDKLPPKLERRYVVTGGSGE